MLANEMADNVLVQFEKLNSQNAPGIQDSQLSIILTNAEWHFVQTRLSKILNSKKEGFEETEVRSQGLSALVKDSATTSIIEPISNENLKYGRFWTLPLDFMYAILERCEINKLDCGEYSSNLDKGTYTSGTSYSLNDIVFYEETNTFYQSLSNNNTATITNSKYWKEIEGAEGYIVPITHDEYNKGRFNPFKKPYFDGSECIVWRMTYSRDDSGYDDSTTIISNGYNYITSQTPKRHELITDGTFEVIKYKLRYIRIPREIVVDRLTPANQRHCELDESTHQAIVNIAVDMLKESLSQPDQQIIPSMQQIE